MATNRYPASCSVCGARIPAHGGLLKKVGREWQVTHLSCAGGEASVIEIRTSGGTFTQNRRGRCEDAPCCGCCTI